MRQFVTYIPVAIVFGFIVYTLQKTNSTFETFSNYSLENIAKSANIKYGSFLLLNDSFPVTSNPNKLTDNQYSHVPTYHADFDKSPENGTTTPSDFSGAFYRPVHMSSKVNKTLPLAPIYNARRVNYYLSH